MQGRLFPRLPVALVLAGLAGWTAPARTEGRAAVFTADQEACFARVYDHGHLAKHPRQRVTTFHLMRLLGERPDAENYQPGQREEAIQSFRLDGQASVSVFVNIRGHKRSLHNTLICDQETSGGVSCAGGGFIIRRDRANTLLLSNNGFVLSGGCGERGESLRLEPGTDDGVFRLEEQPLAVCRAEEDRARPMPAGVPLRERFKEDEAFCFGRDYDAVHLRANPRQEVTSIRVGRLDPAAEQADNNLPLWLDRVQLSVTFALRSGGPKKTARYVCSPRAANWECQRQVPGERAARGDSCSDRAIYLQRGPRDDVLLLNGNSGLPIDNECETARSVGQFPESPPTRSDDRSFRLARMPLAACRQ